MSLGTTKKQCETNVITKQYQETLLRHRKTFEKKIQQRSITPLFALPLVNKEFSMLFTLDTGYVRITFKLFMVIVFD